MEDIGLTLDGIREFLDGQIERCKRPLVEQRFPSYETYMLAWGRLSAMRDARAEFESVATQVTNTED